MSNIQKFEPDNRKYGFCRSNEVTGNIKSKIHLDFEFLCGKGLSLAEINHRNNSLTWSVGLIIILG